MDFVLIVLHGYLFNRIDIWFIVASGLVSIVRPWIHNMGLRMETIAEDV